MLLLFVDYFHYFYYLSSSQSLLRVVCNSIVQFFFLLLCINKFGTWIKNKKLYILIKIQSIGHSHNVWMASSSDTTFTFEINTIWSVRTMFTNELVYIYICICKERRSESWNRRTDYHFRNIGKINGWMNLNFRKIDAWNAYIFNFNRKCGNIYGNLYMSDSKDMWIEFFVTVKVTTR